MERALAIKPCRSYTSPVILAGAVLGPMPIADIQAGHVRRWRKHLLDAEVSAVTLAKAYRLLNTIMTTAADDVAIRRNPCRIKGGEASPEQSGQC